MMTGEVASDLAALYGQNLTKIVEDNIRLKAMIENMKRWLMGIPGDWTREKYLSEEEKQRMIENIQDWLSNIPVGWLQEDICEELLECPEQRKDTPAPGGLTDPDPLTDFTIPGLMEDGMEPSGYDVHRVTQLEESLEGPQDSAEPIEVTAPLTEGLKDNMQVLDDIKDPGLLVNQELGEGLEHLETMDSPEDLGSTEQGYGQDRFYKTTQLLNNQYTESSFILKVEEDLTTENLEGFVKEELLDVKMECLDERDEDQDPWVEKSLSNSQIITWMQQRRLLASYIKCEGCDSRMNWTKSSRNSDGFAWRCQRKGCPRQKSTKSIRNGSFFESSKISLQTWAHVLYLWTERIGVGETSKIVNLSTNTMIDMYCSFREMCCKHFEANPIELGGPGHIVYIRDQSLIKPKHQKGRAPDSEQLVFGMVDTSSTPCVGYMQVVPNRDAHTLLPIVERVVRPGSIIHSGRQDIGFTHQTVNQHCVNQEAHTRTAEAYWNRHKSHMKTMKGCRKRYLSSYLHEFMWHERFPSNALDIFCEHIASQYPLM